MGFLLPGFCLPFLRRQRCLKVKDADHPPDLPTNVTTALQTRLIYCLLLSLLPTKVSVIPTTARVQSVDRVLSAPVGASVSTFKPKRYTS